MVGTEADQYLRYTIQMHKYKKEKGMEYHPELAKVVSQLINIMLTFLVVTYVILVVTKKN